jgi:hypothetical protein
LRVAHADTVNVDKVRLEHGETACGFGLRAVVRGGEARRGIAAGGDPRERPIARAHGEHKVRHAATERWRAHHERRLAGKLEPPDCDVVCEHETRKPMQFSRFHDRPLLSYDPYGRKRKVEPKLVAVNATTLLYR